MVACRAAHWGAGGEVGGDLPMPSSSSLELRWWWPSTSRLRAVVVIRWLAEGLYSSSTYPLGDVDDVSVVRGVVGCQHRGGQRGQNET